MFQCGLDSQFLQIASGVDQNGAGWIESIKQISDAGGWNPE
jgi:hypothetical protein